MEMSQGAPSPQEPLLVIGEGELGVFDVNEWIEAEKVSWRSLENRKCMSRWVWYDSNGLRWIRKHVICGTVPTPRTWLARLATWLKNPMFDISSQWECHGPSDLEELRADVLNSIAHKKVFQVVGLDWSYVERVIRSCVSSAEIVNCLAKAQFGDYSGL